MFESKSINTILPHDPQVKTFPFSGPSIGNKYQRIYKYLCSKGILGKLEQIKLHPDVPQFYIYACERPSGEGRVNTSYGFGGDENEKGAVTKAICEGIEHYCLLHEKKERFIYGSYNELKREAVDPRIFVPFSKKQLLLEKYKKFLITADTPINWLKGYSLTDNRNALLPASLVYANFSSEKHNEPIIRIPISTGAACGPTKEFAICNGLCEIIERDGYIISFTSGIQKKQIVIHNSDSELSDFIRKFRRYNFEIYFIDTSLDSSVFSVVCLLIDKTGCGPAVSVGLGGGLEPKSVIKTSAIEALRTYITNRTLLFRREKREIFEKGSYEWFVMKKRQAWSAPHMVKRVEDLLCGARKVELPKVVALKSDSARAEYLIQRLREIGCDAYYVDITIPEIEKFGLKVIKTLVPQMIPLWHDGRYPYLGMDRFWSIPQKYGSLTNTSLSVDNIVNIHPF